MLQKTLKLTIKTFRFEKNLPVFFDLMAFPKPFSMHKTLNGPHLKVVLEKVN
jgi:hypothetical protein